MFDTQCLRQGELTEQTNQYTGTCAKIFAQVAKINERCMRNNMGIYHQFIDLDVRAAYDKWYKDPQNLAEAGLDMW